MYKLSLFKIVPSCNIIYHKPIIGFRTRGQEGHVPPQNFIQRGTACLDHMTKQIYVVLVQFFESLQNDEALANSVTRMMVLRCLYPWHAHYKDCLLSHVQCIKL